MDAETLDRLWEARRVANGLRVLAGLAGEIDPLQAYPVMAVVELSLERILELLDCVAGEGGNKAKERRNCDEESDNGGIVSGTCGMERDPSLEEIGPEA